MKRISIDPITRLEGHGRIEIFLDDGGDVANAYFQVPEFRGFERFCVGRLAEEMPILTSRICGICPEAHHLASVKALDVIFGVKPTETAQKIRELVYTAFFVNDHATHFFALGGPDLLVGADAPPGERNLFGVMAKLGREAAVRFIACRKRNHHVLQRLGGRGIHLVAGVPGGWSRRLGEEDVAVARDAAAQNIDFARFALDLFERAVLRDNRFSEMLHDACFIHRTYSMGTVDAQNKVGFYDGTLRIVDPDGAEYARYQPKDYVDHIAEHVEPWTYLKFPYLRTVGWKGLVDGTASGVYCATPLARLNVADGMATSLAQEHYEQLYDYFGSRRQGGRNQPVHHRLATHWARLIELLYAAERMLELASDEDIMSSDIRNMPRKKPRSSGVGCVEAPRGTLTHDYSADENGVITKVNIISGTTNNHAPIAMSIKRAAQRYIRRGVIVEEGLLNRIEMAFRLYDPCLACATHADGSMVSVVVRDGDGGVIRVIQR
ncbi:MAG TPA: Ni/Fe hydrogenase subunit alpha [Dissulfurispiraceae bacterium]|nr:Ni/Fe hydrogenase subunit alpha [Dissulfurispiraceae bacterium]